MAFTVRGTSHGEEVEVTWAGGKLSCNFPDVVQEIEAYIATVDEIGPPGGPMWGQPILDNPDATIMAIAQVLGPVQLVKGVVPRLPKIPKGAIA